MKWSYKKPDAPGFWFRRMGGSVCVMELDEFNLPRVALYEDTEWSGPISLPTEPKKACPHKYGFIQGRFDKRFECPKCGMLESTEATDALKEGIQ